jgi:hypothetical protein
MRFVFSGELRFFILNAYRQKGVLNKKGRRKDCEEVGSDQSFPVGEREPEPFSPETRIIRMRAWLPGPGKRALPGLEMARFKIGVPKGGALFLLPINDSGGFVVPFWIICPSKHTNPIGALPQSGRV